MVFNKACSQLSRAWRNLILSSDSVKASMERNKPTSWRHFGKGKSPLREPTTWPTIPDQLFSISATTDWGKLLGSSMQEKKCLYRPDSRLESKLLPQWWECRCVWLPIDERTAKSPEPRCIGCFSSTIPLIAAFPIFPTFLHFSTKSDRSIFSARLCLWKCRKKIDIFPRILVSFPTSFLNDFPSRWTEKFKNTAFESSVLFFYDPSYGDRFNHFLPDGIFLLNSLRFVWMFCNWKKPILGYSGVQHFFHPSNGQVLYLKMVWEIEKIRNFFPKRNLDQNRRLSWIFFYRFCRFERRTKSEFRGKKWRYSLNWSTSKPPSLVKYW